jgi:hypothetical protein
MWFLRSPEERRDKCENCHWKPIALSQERGIRGFSLGNPENNWTLANDICAAWTPYSTPAEELESYATESAKTKDTFQQATEENFDLFEAEEENDHSAPFSV